MNTKKLNFQNNRKYFIGLSVVMVVNFLLGVFLINNVLAQKTEINLTNQPAIKVEVVSQKNCPLLITVLDVDNNSDDVFQNIRYTIQNVSANPIRAYTLVGEQRVGGKIMTNSLMVKLFQPQQVKIAEFDEERANIKEDSKILLSIDYVEFANGSSWGKDKYQTSLQIKQEFAGRKAAIDFFKNLIINRELITLTNALEQNILDYQVPILNGKMDDKELRGYKAGYKSIVSFLQENKTLGDENLLKKLDELEQIMIKEVEK